MDRNICHNPINSKEFIDFIETCARSITDWDKFITRVFYKSRSSVELGYRQHPLCPPANSNTGTVGSCAECWKSYYDMINLEPRLLAAIQYIERNNKEVMK